MKKRTTEDGEDRRTVAPIFGAEPHRFMNPGALAPILDRANVVGIGESAHFVSQFSAARSFLIRHLVERYGYGVICLECSHYQAERVNEWLQSSDSIDEISTYCGPLTRGLYGSVLEWLKRYVESTGKKVEFLGMDIPNALTPKRECEALIEQWQAIDPHVEARLKALGKLLEDVEGESAVVTATKWGEIDRANRDRAVSITCSLRLRLKALAPIYVERGEPDKLTTLSDTLRTVQYTLEALSAMNALFEGKSIEAETSARDYFMAQSVVKYLNRCPDAKVMVLAHNNHIQKEPVVFSGELAGVPMGQHLFDFLPGYRAIALTHVGETVPEMNFPDSESPVGFSVTQTNAAEIGDESVERLYSLSEGDEDYQLLALDREQRSNSIRSQSSTEDVEVSRAFDAVICAPQATKDGAVEY